MDLLSMLNNDDTKPAGPSVSAIVTTDRLPSESPSLTTPSLPAPLGGGQESRNPHATQDPSAVSRKRQRVDDSPSSPPAALPTQPQTRDNSGAVNPDVSPQQVPKPLPAQSPSSRNNSIIMVNDWKSELEPSIVNIQPSEELTRYISDFIFLNLNEEGLEQLEIEAKLGKIIDVNTNQRLKLPVQTETVIGDTSQFSIHTRFESNMTEKQHRFYNQYLNQAFSESRPQQNGSSGSHKPRRIPISYKHTKQTDSTYTLPHEGNSRAAQKFRVTRNAEGDILATIIKDNLGHLNVFSPRTAFDWRISINNERKVELPKGVELRSERRKDRMTYIHQHCQVDLTQVINPAEREKSHELEVELSDIERLRVEAENAKAGKTSNYANMVQVFVDNVRLLARAEKALIQ